MPVKTVLRVALYFVAFFLIALGVSAILYYGFHDTSDTLALTGALLVALGATILWHQKNAPPSE
jgi:hypothetical protein